MLESSARTRHATALTPPTLGFRPDWGRWPGESPPDLHPLHLRAGHPGIAGRSTLKNPGGAFWAGAATLWAVQGTEGGRQVRRRRVARPRPSAGGGGVTLWPVGARAQQPA